MGGIIAKMHFSCKSLWCDGHFHESTRERTNVREGVGGIWLFMGSRFDAKAKVSERLRGTAISLRFRSNTEISKFTANSCFKNLDYGAHS